MRYLLFILIISCSLQVKSQSTTYEDGTQLKYRLMLAPLEVSAEWITINRHWSSRLSFGVSPNAFAAYYFKGEPSAESFLSINPRVGLDLRKYFNPATHDAFFGYFMELNNRYYFPLVDFNGYLRIAYHAGGTWHLGNNGFVTAAIGAALYNETRDSRWGVGPSASFGIGIDLN